MLCEIEKILPKKKRKIVQQPQTWSISERFFTIFDLQFNFCLWPLHSNDCNKKNTAK